MGMSASQRPKLASIAAAIILLAGCDSGDAEKATATPSAASPCPAELGTCRGDLAAGTYRSATFRPPITYTVPAGWTNGIDLPRNFLLARVTDPVEDFYGGNAINAMPNVVAAAQNCEEDGEPGVGRTAADLSRWIDGLPGVQASPSRPVTVGGWSGFVLDVQLAAGWTKTCPIAEEPMVPLLQTGDRPSSTRPAPFSRRADPAGCICWTRPAAAT